VKVLSVIYIFLVCLVIGAAGLGRIPSELKFYHHIPYGDKVGHFFLIGILSFCISILDDFRSISLFKNKIYRGSVICFVLTSLEEFSQIFVSERTFSVMDLMSNYLGVIVIGQLLLRFLRSFEYRTSALL